MYGPNSAGAVAEDAVPDGATSIGAAAFLPVSAPALGSSTAAGVTAPATATFTSRGGAVSSTGLTSAGDAVGSASRKAARSNASEAGSCSLGSMPVAVPCAGVRRPRLRTPNMLKR